LFFSCSLATETPCDSRFDPEKVETFSWDPRIFVYPNFLTTEECDHFISKGLSAGLERSAVAVAPGEKSENTARTSYGTFLSDDGDIVLRRVESRIAQWSQIPIEHGEVRISFLYNKKCFLFLFCRATIMINIRKV